MGAVAELPAGRWNHTHLPLRVAYCDRLHHCYPAVAARGWTGSVQVRRLGQHNDPGGLRDRVGDRRRRRDPRRREHHATPASCTARGRYAKHGAHHSGRFARGAGADRLRYPYRGHGGRACPVHAGPDRILLQAADYGLRARDCGLARRGDDGNAGALPDPAAWRATRRA